MYIDVHCHLNERDYQSVDDLVALCQERGIKKIIAVGYDVASSTQAKEYAEKYDCVYFTAGLHPTEKSSFYDGCMDDIKSLTAHPKCVAVGEIGLDYHYPDTDKAFQHAIFLEQLKMANDCGLPVQIHSRDCTEDMLNFLKEHQNLLGCGALLHCYSHSPEIARELEKLGVYFSFGGTCTYKGSKRAKKSIKAISLNRLLTETDSPYLPPRSKMGEFPNTSLSIPEIASEMASLKEMEEGDFVSAVWQNAHTLFKKLT